MKLNCIGQNTIIIENKEIIYIDPIEAKNKTKADIILLTGVQERINPEVINQISKRNTKIICPKESIEKIKNNNIIHEDYKTKKFNIQIIPAYKLELVQIPSPNKYGFLINSEKEAIYYSGPTDVIPEMNLIDTNVAILCINGEGMDLFEALASTNVIAADEFIPISFAKKEDIIKEECTKFLQKCIYQSKLLNKF